MSNLNVSHEAKLAYFRQLRETLPKLKAEQETLEADLHNCESGISRQQVLAATIIRLRKTIKNATRSQAAKKCYQAWIEGQNSTPPPSDTVIAAYEKLCGAESEIAAYYDVYERHGRLQACLATTTHRIHTIEDNEEETEYMLATAQILTEHADIAQEEKDGRVADVSGGVYPPEHRFEYTHLLVEDIEVQFVTGENRPIFAPNTATVLKPQMYAHDILAIYNLMLQQCCGQIDTIPWARVYLSEYQLPLDYNNQNDGGSRSVGEAIRFYGIPLRFDSPMWVYICIPVDEPSSSDLASMETTAYLSQGNLLGNNCDSNLSSNSTCNSTGGNETTTRRKLFRQYKAKVRRNEVGVDGQPIVTASSQRVCGNCMRSDTCVVAAKNGDIVCSQCGGVQAENCIAEGLKGVPFSDQVTVKSKSPYIPLMHLNDILKQRQGIESSAVPDEIIEAVDRERRKHRCEPSRMTDKLVRGWLKKLKKGDPGDARRYARYYQHAAQIIDRLDGPAPVRYTIQEEACIRDWFLRIQEPFERFCPKRGENRRDNLVSYKYIMRQICRLIAYHSEDAPAKEFWSQHAKSFALLKDTTKLMFYDSLWMQMMNMLGEPFFPVM